MAQNVINPQDLTGAQKARLEAEAAAQKQEAAKRMSMVTEAASNVSDKVINLATGSVETVGEDGKPVTVKVPKKKMRVNTSLENVTIGHGTDYTFVPGQMYEVDEDVYRYLDEKGFVWH